MRGTFGPFTRKSDGQLFCCELTGTTIRVVSFSVPTLFEKIFGRKSNGGSGVGTFFVRENILFFKNMYDQGFRGAGSLMKFALLNFVRGPLTIGVTMVGSADDNVRRRIIERGFRLHFSREQIVAAYEMFKNKSEPGERDKYTTLLWEYWDGPLEDFEEESWVNFFNRKFMNEIIAQDAKEFLIKETTLWGCEWTVSREHLYNELRNVFNRSYTMGYPIP